MSMTLPPNDGASGPPAGPQAPETYHALIQSLADAIFVIDAKGQVLDANEAATELTRYSQEELLRLHVSDVVSSGLDWNEEEYARFREEGRWRGDLQIRRKDGTLAPVEARTAPLTLPSGTVYVSVVRDITERARVETAQRFLAEAGSLLANSLDYETTLASIVSLAVPELADWCSISMIEDGGAVRQLASVHADPERERHARELQQRYPFHLMLPEIVRQALRRGESRLFPEISEAMLALVARTPEQLELLRGLGLRSLMIVPLVARGRTLGAVSFGSASADRRFGPADLALAEELARHAALAVDNARLYQEAQRALHARDEALAIAQVERARLNDVFMQTPAMIATAQGPDHIITFANVLFMATTGVTEADLGRPARDIFPRLGQAGYLTLLDQVFTSDRPFVGNEVRLHVLTQAGGSAEERFFNVVVVPVHRDGSRVDGVLLHAVEVTEQVESRRRVEALAAENAELYRQAQEALRARDEFISLVSHDLRSPLMTIRGTAQLLQRRAARLGGPVVERLGEGLGRIDQTTTTMTALIDQLLDIARVEAGRSLELERRRIDLVALVRRAVELHQQATERHEIRLETSAPRLMGMWDASRLERVLANLLSNAIKYSPNGGAITITLTHEAGDRPAGSQVVLRVRDEGIGVPAADLPRIFERFYRGANVTGRIGGTGIGLAGARQVVEQHGGTMTIESQEGAGTTVTVRLPLRSRAA